MLLIHRVNKLQAVEARIVRLVVLKYRIERHSLSLHLVDDCLKHVAVGLTIVR